MEKILSVIIPTYNMEKYLNRCLDSLIIDEGMEFLEVIVINDGSKDSSLSIAKSYVEKYPNTFKVVDKENGNYGSCINRGLKEAIGKYVKVLDADDHFSTKDFKALIKTMLSVDVDIIFNDHTTINENGNQLSYCSNNYPAGKFFDYIEYFTENKKTIPYIHMHNVSYKRDNLLKIKYKQTEGISYTDVEWTFLPISVVKKAYYLNRPVYKYLLGREGQTISKDSCIKNINSLKTLVLSLIQSYTENYKIVNDLIKQYFLYRISIEIVRIYRMYFIDLKDRINELIEFDDTIKHTNYYIYEYIGDLRVNKYIKYIKFWRKYPNSRVVISFIRLNILINNFINKS